MLLLRFGPAAEHVVDGEQLDLGERRLVFFRDLRIARALHAAAVGLSTVPEVILARFLGLKAAACSVITNLAAAMTGAELSHDETKDMAPLGGKRLALVLRKVFQDGMLEG